jgi:hypothetical protein
LPQIWILGHTTDFLKQKFWELTFQNHGSKLSPNYSLQPDHLWVLTWCHLTSWPMKPIKPTSEIKKNHPWWLYVEPIIHVNRCFHQSLNEFSVNYQSYCYSSEPMMLSYFLLLKPKSSSVKCAQV